MINFIAELNPKAAAQPAGATPSHNHDRRYTIYELYFGPYPEESYWLDWGGYYDNLKTDAIALYITKYLIKVMSFEDLYRTSYALYIHDMFAYFNIPKHPWLYKRSEMDLRETIGFLSSVLNPQDPSDIMLNNRPHEVRLNIPQISVKLSDVISGLELYTSFSVTLINDDGYFDIDTNLFNAPAHIRKSWKDNPQLTDFIPIRYGLVETVSVNGNDITINCADQYRAMEEPVCSVITESDFPYAEDYDKVIGKELPIVYGKGFVELTKIQEVTQDENKYVVLAEHITSLDGLLDDRGDPVKTYTKNADGTITALNFAKYALITGYTENRLGYIITHILEQKSDIPYTASNWDQGETNAYRNSSPRVNMIFTTGKVKDAIKKLLKSDMGFLIEKHTGELTLRKWGNSYPVHTIPSWLITQKPKKDFNEAYKQYFSSCIVKYDYAYKNREKEFHGNLTFIDNEESAESLYNKKVRKIYETYLINEKDALDLAVRLSSRFSYYKETITVAVGSDTSTFNLLDKIDLKILINERLFSRVEQWIIKGIDPAQDILTLEAV